MPKVHCAQVRGGREQALCATYRVRCAEVVSFSDFLMTDPLAHCVRCELRLIRLGIWNAFSELSPAVAAKLRP